MLWLLSRSGHVQGCILGEWHAILVCPMDSWLSLRILSPPQVMIRLRETLRVSTLERKVCDGRSGVYIARLAGYFKATVCRVLAEAREAG